VEAEPVASEVVLMGRVEEILERGAAWVRRAVREEIVKWLEARGADRENVAVYLADMNKQLARIAEQKGELHAENARLRQAKERLEAMQAENLFKFVQKIDDRSFRVVCAVLVHGDVAKAARALDMRDSTLREFIGRWQQRGGAHLGLLEILQWRKRKRIVGTVPFNDALLYKTDEDGNREAVLKEVLDGLLSMTEGNWPDICAELETLLREQLGK
jgi:hypothetical protein